MDLVLIAKVVTVLASSCFNELEDTILVACTGTMMPTVLDSPKPRNCTKVRGDVTCRRLQVSKLEDI